MESMGGLKITTPTWAMACLPIPCDNSEKRSEEFSWEIFLYCFLPSVYSASDKEILWGPLKAALIMLRYKLDGFKDPYLFCREEMTPLLKTIG